MADMNIGVAGVSRGAKAGYIGVNGVARRFTPVPDQFDTANWIVTGADTYSNTVVLPVPDDLKFALGTAYCRDGVSTILCYKNGAWYDWRNSITDVKKNGAVLTLPWQLRPGSDIFHSCIVVY